MNKQITEDYVSFEIAKLLREKGFDASCDSYYEWFESNITLYKGNLPEFSDSNINHNKYDDRTSRPSQSLVLKWLRELGIVITIKTHYPSNPELCKIPYSFLIEDYRPERNMEKEHGKYSTGYSSCANMDDFLTENKLLFDGFNFGEFEKYEQAIEAALKYTLENLI